MADEKPETMATASRCSAEDRRCDQCGLEVPNPLATRCPRCWAPLSGMSCGSCSGCSLSRGHNPR